uniref:ATP synthase F0 subunit 8 n=1 Tax=Citellophilus tesquorum TaxID=506900 RepID=UPI0030FE9377
MPQMAPMYWLILLLLFITCFIMIIIINYFSILNNPIKNKNNFFNKSVKFNWKW